VSGTVEQPPLCRYRLPGGRHSLPRAIVSENQRWRLLSAVCEVLGQEGYARATSAAVAARAGVSRATFYEHFENLDDCIAAAHQMAAGCLTDMVGGACEAQLDDRARVRAAVDAVLEVMSAEPSFGAVLGPQVAAAVPRVARSRGRLVAQLAARLAALRRRLGVANHPPSTESRLLEAALAFASDRLPAEQGKRSSIFAEEVAQILMW
jgi:AcrR family transcriptional regulator